MADIKVGTYSGELSVFSIGGADQLEFLKDGNFTVTEMQEDGAPASRIGGNMQGVKLNAAISADLFSDSSTDIRVQQVNLTTGTLGGVSLLGAGGTNIFKGLELDITMPSTMRAGMGLLWGFPTVDDRMFGASLDLELNEAAAPSFLVDMLSGTYADQNKILSFVLSGVTITIPFRMTGHGLPIGKGTVQKYSLGLADRSARSGVTVLPSGTTSLLEKAINLPKTALAFAFTPKATKAIAYTGNMIWQSYKIKLTDSGLAIASVAFASQGTVTGANVA